MSLIIGRDKQKSRPAIIVWSWSKRFLRIVAVLLPALPVGVPLFYLFWQAGQLDFAELWQTFGRLKLLDLLWQVFWLATFATIWAVLLGGVWAWLVARTDVPGRRFFRALGPLPLVIPPYVGALAYTALLTPGGIFHTFLAQNAQVKTFQYPFPDLIHGLGGAAFVLGTFTSPYVFSTVYSALQRLDPTLEEAARSLGYGRWAVFWKVTFPLLRPALTAGGLLVFLYACVDFGVVSLLRLPTFTTVIYNYLLAGFNLAASAGLCLVLVGIVWLVLVGQRYALGQAHYTQQRLQTPPLLRLGWWRWPALLFLLLAVLLTLGLPLGVLLYQLSRFSSFAALTKFLGEQLGYTGNTLLLAVASATLALVLTGLVGFWRWKKPTDRLVGFSDNILQAGYALPGTVLGLSLVGISLQFFPLLYGTPLVLLLAYLILFAAPALQAVKAALAGVNPTLEEAARALGEIPLRAAWRVILPLAWPGLVGSWLVVFMLSLRELAATLILRPPGYDTLAVRIWVHTSDVGPDPGSAVVALLLVGVAVTSWLLILFLEKLQIRAGKKNNDRT